MYETMGQSFHLNAWRSLGFFTKLVNGHLSLKKNRNLWSITIKEVTRLCTIFREIYFPCCNKQNLWCLKFSKRCVFKHCTSLLFKNLILNSLFTISSYISVLNIFSYIVMHTYIFLSLWFLSISWIRSKISICTNSENTRHIRT